MNTTAPAASPSAPPSRNTRTLCGRLAGSQRGALIPLFVVALVPLIAMTGLALDIGHMYWNRTRLHNIADAVALSVAKRLDDTGVNYPSVLGVIESEATNACAINLYDTGYDEYDPCSTMGLAFSDTPSFPGGGGSAHFVQVTFDSFPQPSWLLWLIGFTNIETGPIIAVAGPSPRLSCPANIVPLAACDGNPPYVYVDSDSSGKNTNPLRMLSLTGSEACTASDCPLIYHNYKNNSYCASDGQSISVDTNSYSATAIQKGLKSRIVGIFGDTGAPGEPLLARGNPSKNYYVNTTVAFPTPYVAYKNALNGVFQDFHPRVLTLPVIDCPVSPAPPSGSVSIKRFECFYVADNTGNNTFIPTPPQSPPFDRTFIYIYPFSVNTSYNGCLNQGTGIDPGTTIEEGPHTIMLYRSQP